MRLDTDSQRVTWTAFAILVMFYLFNSMIYGIKRFIDIRRLFDAVLHSSLDGTKNIARIANAVQVTIFVY